MIPHIIHYCWFGSGPKPELVKRCIASWREFFPGWQIMEWTEKNFDIAQCPYSKGAYLSKKWAFVSDYARFKILEKYGGIYFDTDVELLKRIPDKIFEHQAFTGVESCSNLVSPGLLFACEPDNFFVKEMVRIYEKESWDEKHLKTVNEIITELLCKHGYVCNGAYQEVKGLAIYEAEIFSGYDLLVDEEVITDKTISVHHYASSWKKTGPKRKIQRIVKWLIGIENYRRLLFLKQKILPRRKSG